MGTPRLRWRSAPSEARLAELEKRSARPAPNSAEGLRRAPAPAQSGAGVRMTKCVFGQETPGEFAGERPASDRGRGQPRRARPLSRGDVRPARLLVRRAALGQGRRCPGRPLGRPRDAHGQDLLPEVESERPATGLASRQRSSFILARMPLNLGSAASAGVRRLGIHVDEAHQRITLLITPVQELEGQVELGPAPRPARRVATDEVCF
ncbi:MAG: hypothetical protein MZV70_70660 [Desulfobacterales bacterium]|nr:hypothetical protein [Desulfobacterales bacterium]